MSVDEIKTPVLSFAIKYGSDEIIEYLISNKVDLNKIDSNGVSPLMHALNNKRKNIVELLIDNEVSLTEKDIKVMIIVYYAINSGVPELIDIFINKYSLPLTNVNENNETILHEVARKGDEKLLEIILSKIPKEEFYKYINIQSIPEKLTPLMVAISNKNILFSEYILLCGANPYLKNKLGNDALLMASEYDCLDLVKKLICDYHCSVSTTNELGLMHYTKASSIGQVDIIEFLLSSEVLSKHNPKPLGKICICKYCK